MQASVPILLLIFRDEKHFLRDGKAEWPVIGAEDEEDSLGSVLAKIIKLHSRPYVASCMRQA